jgi:NADP-dependent aldehyde dehydrogenase
VELPRATGQLRQAARAVRTRAWCQPVLDLELDIRSMFAPLEAPVFVLGPNNLPLAFNAVMGGDFAAAIAAQNPVIAKAHPSHPGTTRLLAEIALDALEAAGLPASSLQLVYDVDPELGLELVADARVGATAFTGSRRAGLLLKAAADRAGKPIYLELGSINPVFVLPGALRERGQEIAQELFTSCSLAAGQFCTNPGLCVLIDGPETRQFLEWLAQHFRSEPSGCLFSAAGAAHLSASVSTFLGSPVRAAAAAGAGAETWVVACETTVAAGTTAKASAAASCRRPRKRRMGFSEGTVSAGLPTRIRGR